MNQTVFGGDKAVFCKRLRKDICLCAIIAVVVLICNIVLAVLSDDDNYRVFMWVNIATDICAGIFIVTYVSVRVSVPKKILRLTTSKYSETYCGVVRSVSEGTLRYADLNCFEANLSGRIFYVVDNGAITLEKGREYSVETVSKIIVAADNV